MVENEFSFAGHDRHNQAVDAWLESLGFKFNPFLILDASADPNLVRYMVQNSAFDIVWGGDHTFVFEPPGGGKSALRVRTINACYQTQEPNQPFPISYLPPYLQWRHTHPGLEEHLTALTRSGASQLLLSLALRPHWFLRLDSEERRAVRSLFACCLAAPLASYLTDLRQTGDVEFLRRRLKIPLFLSSNDADQALVDFCDCLAETPGSGTAQRPYEHWRLLVDVLTDVIQVESIWLMVDGIDATEATATDPAVAIGVMQPLMEQLADWEQLKCIRVVHRKYRNLSV